MLTLFIKMFYSLASILFPIHWVEILANMLILMCLLDALATQVTRNSTYPLHLVTRLV